jgi:hypothetical protein
VFRTRTHVGIYVDDAPGAIARTSAIVPHLRSQASLLSPAALEGLAVGDDVLRLRLPSPVTAGPAVTARAPETVPRSLGSAGAAALVAWMEQESPDLLFVDGPTDVALFARLAGVPVITLRRHGRRTPTQRQLIARTVLGMLAPYSEDLAPRDATAVARTVHIGLLSRFAGRERDRERARGELGVGPTEQVVTVLSGKDGLELSTAELAATAAATPGWRWLLVGEDAAGARHGTIHPSGWVADPWPHLVAADVVVAPGSLSAVADVAAAGVPLLVSPRRSADDEQRRFADALGSVGAAVPLGFWPQPARWAGTLEAAARMDVAPLASRGDVRAGARAAEWLDAWAAMPAAAATPTSAVGEELDPILQGQVPAVGAGG